MNEAKCTISNSIQAKARYVESSTINSIQFGEGNLFVAFSYQYKKVCLDGTEENRTKELESMEGITTREEIQRVEKLYKENQHKIFSPPKNFYKMWKKKETLDFLKKFMISGYDDMEEKLSIQNPYTYLEEKSQTGKALENIMLIPSLLDFLGDGLFLRDSLNGEIIPIPVMSEIPLETKNDYEENWKDTVDKLRQIEADGGQFFSMKDVEGEVHIILDKISAISFLDRDLVKFDQKTHWLIEDESSLRYFAFLPSQKQLEDMMRDIAETSSHGKELERFLSYGKASKEKQEKHWRLLVEGIFDCEHGEFRNILKLAKIKT